MFIYVALLMKGKVLSKDGLLRKGDNVVRRNRGGMINIEMKIGNNMIIGYGLENDIEKRARNG